MFERDGGGRAAANVTLEAAKMTNSNAYELKSLLMVTFSYTAWYSRVLQQQTFFHQEKHNEAVTSAASRSRHQIFKVHAGGVIGLREKESATSLTKLAKRGGP